MDLDESDNGEQIGEGQLRHDGEADPGGHFEGIVGTGHQLEQESFGNASGSISLCGTHVTQHQVADQIADLA